MNDDLISRQAAIKAIAKCFCRLAYIGYLEDDASVDNWIGIAERILEAVPSAQPEIIRCKDCKQYTLEVGDRSYSLGFCQLINSHWAMGEGFCAWAERKEHE